MVHHVSFGAEAQPTLLRTRKRPFTRVNQHVCPQVLLLRKSLAASRRGTRIRLGAEVNVHVRPITIQPVERLPALAAAVLLRVFLPIVFDPLFGHRRFTLTLVQVEEQTVIFLRVVVVLLNFLGVGVLAAHGAVVRVRGLFRFTVKVGRV